MWYYTPMLHDIYRYFVRRPFLSIFFLVFLYCTPLFMYPDNFKIDVVISFIFVGLFYAFTKNLFISLFIPFTISTFFLAAAKTYVFQYASPLEYIYETLPDGIFEVISITVGDILSIVLILFFIRERWTRQVNHLTTILNTPILLWIICCWLIYLTISLISSFARSMYPAFSINMLLQYGKIFIFVIGIVYLYMIEKKSNLFFIALLAFLFFQSAVGIAQFTQSLSSYGSAEKVQTIDQEEIDYFSRIQGISLHANAHAFVVTLLATLTFPFVLKTKNTH